MTSTLLHRTLPLLFTLGGLCISPPVISAQSPVLVSVDFDAASYNLLEGNTVSVTLRLSSPPGRVLHIPLDTTFENGATGIDFDNIPPSVIFGPHDTEAQFSVTAISDTDADDGEMVTISVGDLPPAVILGTPTTATIVLVDNTSSRPTVLEVLRARVTGGAIFFNGPPQIVKSDDGRTAHFQSPDSNQASTYLAFEAQPRWWKVDGLLSARLTTLAVKDTQSTTDNQSLPIPDASIIYTPTSAQWQFGAAINIHNFGDFSGGNTRFQWGVGLPVYRLILQRVSDTQRTRRVWNNDDDLYDAHTIGARLTLYERPQRTIAWMPAAYLDVSLGWFQNFETVAPNPDLPADGKRRVTHCLRRPSECLATQLPPKGDFKVVTHPRLYIEGRVFINKSLYLGFDLNNGPGPDFFQLSAGWTINLNTLFPRPSLEDLNRHRGGAVPF